MRIETSPNFNRRPPGASPLAVVLHYTAAGRAGGSIRWLCNPDSGASAHYVISRVGRVTMLVDLAYRAWHAGAGRLVIGGDVYRDPNDVTIGIELANYGMVHPDGSGGYLYESGRQIYPCAATIDDPVQATLRWDNGHEADGWWEPYPDAQIDALGELLGHLAREYPSVAGNVVGHEEIARPVGRKLDPGPVFPWGRIDRSLPRRTSGRVTA